MSTPVQHRASVLKELRDESRRVVDELPAGPVFVKDRSHQQRVLAIKDFSARGVSLCLDDELTPGEPVVIELKQSGQMLTFYAYVAWCRRTLPTDGDSTLFSGRCIAGLRVYGSTSLGQLVAH